MRRKREKRTLVRGKQKLQLPKMERELECMKGTGLEGRKVATRGHVRRAR